MNDYVYTRPSGNPPNHIKSFGLGGSYPTPSFSKPKKTPQGVLKDLGRGGFEPPYTLVNRFTVCRL